MTPRLRGNDVLGYDCPMKRVLLLFLLISVSGNAQAAISNDAPVDFTADQLVNDEPNQKIIATGAVHFIQAGRTLRADEVRYDLVNDVVTAIGNVVLVEVNGDTHYADELELTDDMRDGYVKTLQSTLVDGSRFWAATGTRKNGTQTTMYDAVYTPCEPCKLDPEKPPLWQLRAKTVTHDEVDKKIKYDDVTLEFGNTPVMYAPYFSHADGTVKQKSGFLRPTWQLDSQNGTSLNNQYYWAIAPDRDATFGAEVYTGQLPRLNGQYRQRFDDKSLLLEGSLTDSERRVRDGDTTITRDAEMRGHVKGVGRWDMDDKWRSGFDMLLASDDQYFKQYDITAGDVVENQVYAERFDERDYASIRALGFQDLRTSNRAADQPNIFPEAEASFMGAPGQVLGGRWQVNAAALGLQRSGSGADMTRVNLQGGWQRRDVLPIGVVNTVDASVRGDAYYLLDRSDDNTAGVDQVARTLFRAVPIVSDEVSVPFVKPLSGADLLFEPVAALTLVPNLNQGDIPNEDSQDIQVDTSNIFEANRFPGYDRVEDVSRVTYGARTGITAHDGSAAELFLGQSYRFSDKDNPFPENSGLATQSSDYVGRMKIGYQDMWRLDYGFQLASNDLTSVRHEVDTQLTRAPLTLGTRYLYAKEIEGIGVNGPREQIQPYAIYDFSPDWRGTSSMQYDLSAQDSGLRRATFGLDYLGQCATFSTVLQRNLTNSSSGSSATELIFRVGLKNLGEFQTSGIALGTTTP